MKWYWWGVVVVVADKRQPIKVAMSAPRGVRLDQGYREETLLICLFDKHVTIDITGGCWWWRWLLPKTNNFWPQWDN